MGRATHTIRLFLWERRASSRAKRIVIFLVSSVITHLYLFGEASLCCIFIWMCAIIFSVGILIIWTLVAVLIFIVLYKIIEVEFINLFHLKCHAVLWSEIIFILYHFKVIHQEYKLSIILIIFERRYWYSIW